MNVNGRFVPLAILQIYGLHYWIHDVHLFRVLHVLWVLIHICTFVWLLRSLKLGWNFIGLWLLLLMGIFQARNFHDPIASYGFFLQSQGIFLTLALLSLVTWSETPRNKWLVLSSTLALIPLLMYEINIVFYLIALGLLLIAPRSTRLKMRALVTLFAPLVIYALLVTYLRHASDINYSGVKVGSPDLMLATYGKQFLAAFPGVYYFLQWKTEFPISKIFSSFTASPLAWLLILASLYSVFRCVSANKPTIETASPRIRELSIIALCFIFIPPVFVAISNKYQGELRWGLGYLPVYYAYFGVALVLSASATWVADRFTTLRLLIVIVVAILVTANFLVNRNVIDKIDQLFVEPRKSLEQALESGLLDDLHDGDYLTVEGPAYLNRGFFYHYSGKKVITEGGPDRPGLNMANYSPIHYTLERLKKPPYRWKLNSLKDIRFVYGEGWSGYEGALRWSSSLRAVINLQNGRDKPVSVKVVFDLSTLKPRKVKFTINGELLDNLPSFLNGTPVHFEIAPVNLGPGQNSLIIETDVPPESPGNGDSRKLSFVILNIALTERK